MPDQSAPPDPLTAAQAAHRAERVPEALAAYQALAADPAAPSASRAAALHGLAVLRASEAPEETVELLRQALMLHPALPQAGEHLGSMLEALGRPSEAIAAWRAALAADPAQPALWRRFVTLLRTTPGRDPAEAVAACRHAAAAARTATAAESAAIQLEMGLSLLAAGKPGPAISALLRAKALAATMPGTAAPLGAALLARGDITRAIPALRAALAERPTDRASLCALAQALLAQGQCEPAAAALRRGLTLSPGDPGLVALFARALIAAARPEAALAQLRPLLEASAPRAEALLAAGLALAALGRPAEALARFTRALALTPDDPEARYHAALARLIQGDLAGGWPGFALRLHADPNPPTETRLRQPRWTGEQDLAGQRILLHAEQAPSDTLQFIRYLPMVASLGARIQLRVQPDLHELIAAMPALTADPAITLLAPGAAPAQFDLRCALADLPAAFATTLPTIPCAVPYLAPPPDALARWTRILPDGVPRIALCRPGAAPPLDGLAASLYALGPPGAADLPDHIHDLRSETVDATDLAAALCRMDLVIATDGPLLHLAGALARPCFALLPAVADWRWLVSRRDSPWYPTMRLFRGTTEAGEIMQEAGKVLLL